MALYVMISRTNTGAGRMIRCFTGSTYNHVSLALDDDLRHFVSFARYAIDVPLAGGFIEEPVERFLYDGKPVPVMVYRLELDPERQERLARLFALAGHRDSGLIYDTLGALLFAGHIHRRLAGAYTCLGFAAAVLGKEYPSFRALQEDLHGHEFYQGDLRDRAPDSGDRTDPFFRRRGFIRGTGDTLVHFVRLVDRMCHAGAFRDPVDRMF